MERLFFDGALNNLWAQREPMIGLLVAALLGGIIGLERERSGKPAGFRTHLLICVGAALLTELSIGVALLPDGQGGSRGDPGRIAAQIVSGIGFLGAGTIIQARGSVVGLTTAASIWVVAAIGMAVGSRGYVLALGTTALVVVALRLLGRLEERMSGADVQERTIDVELDGGPALLDDIAQAITSAGATAALIGVERTAEHYVASYRTTATEASRHAVVTALLERAGVRRITIR
jgi:putative Mg2+ transporter-C (MgtC) family protein